MRETHEPRAKPVVIGFFSQRRRGGHATRLDALILGVVVAALGAVIKSLLVHGWGDEETASGATLRPAWILAGGATVILIGVAVLLLRWRRKQEGP